MRYATKFEDLQPGDKIIGVIADDGYYPFASDKFKERIPFLMSDVLLVERDEDVNE